MQSWQARADYRRIQRPRPIARAHLHPVNASYLQDICARSEQVKHKTFAELKTCLPAALVDGGALRWCEVPTDGVHCPSFYLLRSSTASLSNHLASGAITDVHNESQRLGFWHHLLPVVADHADAAPPQAVGIDRAVLDDIDVQEQVKEMYKLFTEQTKLSSAADAWTQGDTDGLSSFVSTSYGELALASVTKVVEFMIAHGLQSDDVLFDVGSCYGRALSHVSRVTGIRLCGIEAVPARHNKAMECLAAWDARTRTTGDLLSSTVELIHGDIMDHLPLLFTATHVMNFDARFQPPTRAILQHVCMSLARTRLRMVFCTTKLPLAHYGFELVAELSVTTGQNNFTVYAYHRVRPAVALHARPRDPVVLTVFSGQRVGVRACRDVSVGERLLPVIGEPLALGTWEKLRHDASDRRWQWMVRRDGRGHTC